MKKIAFIALLTILPAYSNADTINIVTKENCTSMSGRLFRCSNESSSFNTENTEDYIIMESLATPIVGKTCRTPFPIHIDVSSNDINIDSFSVFSPGDRVYDQTDLPEISFTTRAPFSNRAFFDKNCEIALKVEHNSVNTVKSSKLMNTRINQLNAELKDVERLIELETLIAELVSALNTYSALFEAASQGGGVSLELINSLLADNCSGPDCSWSAHMDTILENQENIIDFSEAFFLMSLAFELDTISDSGCSGSSCSNDILDDKTREALELVLSNATDYSTSEETLIDLIKRKNIIVNNIADINATAKFYGVTL